MLEARVDLWKAEADLRVVTTNGDAQTSHCRAIERIEAPT